MEKGSMIILSLLKKVFLKYRDIPEELNEVKFDHHVELIIVERSPFYLCDLVHCIQVSAFFQTKKLNTNDQAKPNNKIRSQYYNTYPKASLTLNCTDEQVQEAYEYPHPYGPYYHFQQKYPQFLKERRNIKLVGKLQTILIKQWGVKLVNIANTGYYAPIIQIYEYEPAKSQTINTSISSILYAPQIKQIMEEIRLRDLRRLYAEDPARINPISMCYYLRSNSKNFKNIKSISPFVAVDQQGSILKYKTDESAPKHFVCTSDIQGVCCFMTAISLKGVIFQNQSYLNYQAASKMLPEQPVLANNSLERSNIWSQTSEEDQQNVDAHSQMVHQYLEESSQSSEQDPLRQLYKKQLHHK